MPEKDSTSFRISNSQCGPCRGLYNNPKTDLKLLVSALVPLVELPTIPQAFIYINNQGLFSSKFLNQLTVTKIWDSSTKTRQFLEFIEEYNSIFF